ncbi:hypothetical protein GCM10025795_02530 [Verticiella sediminum]
MNDAHAFEIANLDQRLLAAEAAIASLKHRLCQLEGVMRLVAEPPDEGRAGLLIVSCQIVPSDVGPRVDLVVRGACGYSIGLVAELARAASEVRASIQRQGSEGITARAEAAAKFAAEVAVWNETARGEPPPHQGGTA